VLIKQLGNDVLRLNEAINATRKAREESHSKVYRLVEELQLKFSREITVGPADTGGKSDASAERRQPDPLPGRDGGPDEGLLRIVS